MSDYIDIANTSWDEIPEKVLLPEGTWRLKLRSASFKEPKTENGKATVTFVYEPTMAMDDVDDEKLRAMGEDYDLGNNPIFYTIWLERQTDWHKVKDHINKHGVEASGNIQATFKSLRGREVLAFIGTRRFTPAGTDVVVETEDVSQFAPVDE